VPWLFYRSETEEWRWALVCGDGRTTAASHTGFATRLACVADAKSRGFGRDGTPDGGPGADVSQLN